MAWPVSGDSQQDAAQPHNSGKLLSQQTRLFFAGEATHKEDAYTVQGALLSGALLCSPAMLGLQGVGVPMLCPAE